MTHDQFLRAIIESPDDDLPRLVYADYLEESGDVGHAELIRVQCELAKISQVDPFRNHLEDREHELLNEHEPRLLGNLDEFEIDSLREWKFRRGFLSEITTNAGDLTVLGERLMRRHPITHWTYQPTEMTDWSDPGAIAGSSAMARLRSVDLSASAYPAEHFLDFLTHPSFPAISDLNLLNLSGFDDIVGILERSPTVPSLRSLSLGGRSGFGDRWGGNTSDSLNVVRLVRLLSNTPLERLHLHDCGIDSDGLAAILTAPFVGSLTDLDLSNHEIPSEQSRTFELAHPDMRLKHLDISETHLGGTGLERLLGAPCLEKLADLGINNCGCDRKNMEILAESAFWQNAERLSIRGGSIPAFTIEPLCRSRGPKGLRLLDLSENYLRSNGVRMLAESEWAGSLTWLGLNINFLEDEAADTLANSGRFHELRTLHFTRYHDRRGDIASRPTDLAAEHLANAPSLSNLQVLTVGHTGMSDQGVERLINGPYWKLSGLGLAGLNLTRKAVGSLVRSPNLARLQWLDLSGNPELSGDVLASLVEAPHLSRLCELDVRGIEMELSTRHALRDRLGHRLSE